MICTYLLIGESRQCAQYDERQRVTRNIEVVLFQRIILLGGAIFHERVGTTQTI